MAVVYLARDRKQTAPSRSSTPPRDRHRPVRPALPAGDPDPGPAAAPEHPRPARLRRHRRGIAAALLRHALRRGRDAAPAAGARGAAADRGGEAAGPRDRRSAPLRARAGADPPRREARERAALAGARAGGRFRHRARDQDRSPGRVGNAVRRRPGHAVVYESRAGGGEPRGGRSIGPVWAGVRMYELLTGQPPFTGPTAVAVMARHVLDPVPPITTLRPAVTTGVRRRSSGRWPSRRWTASAA